MAKRRRRSSLTWEALRDKVEKSKVGFVTVSAGDLKQLAGFQKLGRFVVGHIADNLYENGLGYFPSIPEESPRSGMPVRVFKLGSRAELAIMAATRVDPEADKVLEELVLDKAQNLEPIRKLKEIEKLIAA